jgi:hypothetical protein
LYPILFRHKYLLLISANPKLSPRFGLHLAEAGASELQISKVGFPIRKFTDQSLFAAPHDLSQRTTSFIASQRQGIHRIPLRHLIALIIDAHRSAAAVSPPCGKKNDTSIERPFASNAPENVAVKQTSTAGMLGNCRGSLHDRHTIGCTSSSRCRITGRHARASATWFAGQVGHQDPVDDAPLVEPDGIEPTTSCLQSTRSPN